MYANAKMIPLKLFQESGEGGEREQWSGAFKYNIFDTL
jgi:hypothetical protein